MFLLHYPGQHTDCVHRVLVLFVQYKLAVVASLTRPDTSRSCTCTDRMCSMRKTIASIRNSWYGLRLASYPVSTASFFLHVGKKKRFFPTCKKKSWQWRLGTRLALRPLPLQGRICMHIHIPRPPPQPYCLQYVYSETSLKGHSEIRTPLY